jgi:hypothetical protein
MLAVKGYMLIDETRPLASGSVGWDSEILERELTSGVIVDRDSLELDEASGTLLGGLITTTEEHVLVREAHLGGAPAADVKLVK